jgi:predicted  nucleic acid-binding Zn-ribbon protein
MKPFLPFLCAVASWAMVVQRAHAQESFSNDGFYSYLPADGVADRGTLLLVKEARKEHIQGPVTAWLSQFKGLDKVANVGDVLSRQRFFSNTLPATDTLSATLRVIPHEGGDYVLIQAAINRVPLDPKDPRSVLLRRHTDELAKEIYFKVLDDQLEQAKDAVSDAKDDFKGADKEWSKLTAEMQALKSANEKNKVDIDVLKAHRMSRMEELPGARTRATSASPETAKAREKELKQLERDIEKEADKITDLEKEIVENQNQMRLLETELTGKKALRDQYEQEFFNQTERLNAIEMERKRVKRLKR